MLAAGPVIVTIRERKRAKAAPAGVHIALGDVGSGPRAACRRHHANVDVPDMTPEEHQRRGDATDAMFQEMKRRIAEKLRK